MAITLFQVRKQRHRQDKQCAQSPSREVAETGFKPRQCDSQPSSPSNQVYSLLGLGSDVALASS